MKKKMMKYKKGSVKPCNTEETFKKYDYDGAYASASPKAENKPYDADMEVDSKKSSFKNNAETSQIGGHAKKRYK